MNILHHPITKLTLAGIFAIMAISTVAPVHAAPTPPPATSGQALEIAPPLLPLKGDPGQTLKAEINLRDIASTSLFVTSQIDDFTASGEDGTPKILLDQAEPSPYSLKTWLKVPSGFTMKPREVLKVPVTVTIPANAAPGGYYGVVRFSGRPPELEGTGVSLSASLGTLVFLQVNGDAKEDMDIIEFSVTKDGKASKIFESAPITFVERIKNNGNIHEQPTGLITITDMFGKKLASLIVNSESPPRNVLPGTIRKFEQKLDSSAIGNTFLFGRYTATFEGTYGDKKLPLSATTDFWVIPYTLIAIVIGALVVLFVLIRLALYRYKQSIISNSRRRR